MINIIAYKKEYNADKKCTSYLILFHPEGVKLADTDLPLYQTARFYAGYNMDILIRHSKAIELDSSVNLVDYRRDLYRELQLS